MGVLGNCLFLWKPVRIESLEGTAELDLVIPSGGGEAAYVYKKTQSYIKIYA